MTYVCFQDIEETHNHDQIMDWSKNKEVTLNKLTVGQYMMFHTSLTLWWQSNCKWLLLSYYPLVAWLSEGSVAGALVSECFLHNCNKFLADLTMKRAECCLKAMFPCQKNCHWTVNNVNMILFNKSQDSQHPNFGWYSQSSHRCPLYLLNPGMNHDESWH